MNPLEIIIGWLLLSVAFGLAWVLFIEIGKTYLRIRDRWHTRKARQALDLELVARRRYMDADERRRAA